MTNKEIAAKRRMWFFILAELKKEEKYFIRNGRRLLNSGICYLIAMYEGNTGNYIHKTRIRPDFPEFHKYKPSSNYREYNGFDMYYTDLWWSPGLRGIRTRIKVTEKILKDLSKFFTVKD